MATAPFLYKKDVGEHSYLGIEALAKKYFPDIKATSDYRPGSITISGNVSYHARGNAVDFVGSKQRMIDFATWISKNFAPYTMELIHSGGGGINVHNGVRGYRYSAPVVQEHYDHVHWAITNSGLQAAGSGVTGNGVWQDVAAAPAVKKNGVGCAVPASIIVAIGGTGLWTTVHLISGWLSN